MVLFPAPISFFAGSIVGNNKKSSNSQRPHDVVEKYRILHRAADSLLGCQQVHRWAHAESLSCVLHVGAIDDHRQYSHFFATFILFTLCNNCSSQILHFNNSTLEDKPVKVRVGFMALVVHASQKSRLSITPRCWPDTRM